ncbi:MAG: parallel beta-helix repeat protein, partial [Salibacteraceae bacterium]
MKKLLLVLLILPLFSFSQTTYNISGQAYLEGEEDHSSLMFSVINPQNLDTLAVGYPDSTGYYSLDVSPGFYLLNWSHYGHIPQELGNFAFSTDTVLADISLLSGYVQDVCGEVAGVWTSGSVYDVLCDIEVPEGDNLIIEPGVRVRFMEGASMTCYGVLQVLGDSDNRVSFTSREASPLPGDWGHVSLYAEGNMISHLDYEFATNGFSGDNISNTTIDNVVMVGNLSLSANGIYLTNSSDLTITNNTIQVGGEYGIHSYESDNSVVNNNTIRGSYSTTIEMKDCDNCHFEGNTLSGNT